MNGLANSARFGVIVEITRMEESNSYRIVKSYLWLLGESELRDLADEIDIEIQRRRANIEATEFNRRASDTPVPGVLADSDCLSH